MAAKRRGLSHRGRRSRLVPKRNGISWSSFQQRANAAACKPERLATTRAAAAKSWPMPPPPRAREKAGRPYQARRREAPHRKRLARLQTAPSAPKHPGLFSHDGAPQSRPPPHVLGQGRGPPRPRGDNYSAAEGQARRAAAEEAPTGAQGTAPMAPNPAFATQSVGSQAWQEANPPALVEGVHSKTPTCSCRRSRSSGSCSRSSGRPRSRR